MENETKPHPIIPFEVLLYYKSWERMAKINETSENILELKKAETILNHFEEGSQDEALLADLRKDMPSYYPVEQAGKKL